MISVIINKSHLDFDKGNGQYTDKDDCPLSRAIKEQHPNLGLLHVTGFGSIYIKNPDKKDKNKELYIKHNDNHHDQLKYQFHDDDNIKWNMQRCMEMFAGKLDSVTLTYNI